MTLEYSTKLSHHDFDELTLDIESGSETLITLSVDDGNRSRISLTMAELQAIRAMAEAFEKANGIMSEPVSRA